MIKIENAQTSLACHFRGGQAAPALDEDVDPSNAVRSWSAWVRTMDICYNRTFYWVKFSLSLLTYKGFLRKSMRQIVLKRKMWEGGEGGVISQVHKWVRWQGLERIWRTGLLPSFLIFPSSSPDSYSSSNSLPRRKSLHSNSLSHWKSSETFVKQRKKKVCCWKSYTRTRSVKCNIKKESLWVSRGELNANRQGYFTWNINLCLSSKTNAQVQICKYKCILWVSSSQC